MNFVDRLTARFTNRGKALSLYKRGMAKAQVHDHDGAINDYTELIERPCASPRLRAMALYNRALVYAASQESAKAIEDLNMVLAMPETLSEIKMEARRKLVRMQRQSERLR